MRPSPTSSLLSRSCWRKAVPGKRVVVYDAEGYFTAAGLAEKLAGDGHDVELATCLERIAPVTDETLEGPMLRQHLHDVGVRQRPGFLAAEIGEGFIRGTDEFREPVEPRPTPSFSRRSGSPTSRSTSIWRRISTPCVTRASTRSTGSGTVLRPGLSRRRPTTATASPRDRLRRPAAASTRERIVLESAAIGS